MYNNNNYSLTKKKLFNFRLDFGIGLFRFKFFLLKLGLNLNNGTRRFYKLRINLIKRYKLIIFLKKWIIVKKLKYRLKQYFLFLKKIKNYKFLRFKYGLPVNGQRTHTNRKNSFKGLVYFRDINVKMRSKQKYRKNRSKFRSYNTFTYKKRKKK